MYFGVSNRVLATDCIDDATCAITFQGLGFSDEGDGVCAMKHNDDSCFDWDSATLTVICEECRDNQYSVSMLIMGVVTYWSAWRPGCWCWWITQPHVGRNLCGRNRGHSR